MAYSITKARKKPTRKVVATNGLITFDQFCDLIDENVKADLLDGQIFRDSPAIPRHAMTISRLNTLINNYWAEIKPGAQGRLHSKVLPGFWLHPAWFAKSILPPASALLQEILGEKASELL